MKHPLVELTKLVSSKIPAEAWINDPIAKKQGIRNLVQAIKSKAARAGIHKINNILNVKIPIPVSAITQAAGQVSKEKFDIDQEIVQRMLSDFVNEIEQAKTKSIPDKVIKTSTGMYHNASEPEHAFKDNPGTFTKASEPVVTLLDYARALHLIASRYHTQISSAA